VTIAAEPLAHAAVAAGEANPTTQLAGRVRRLRTRAGVGELDRALLVIGGVLLPLGILLVVLGWIGTSRTVLLFEQIPYLISGGLLGLALVFVGGFVYFTYWQTLLVRESRDHHRELVASLARIEQLLGGRSPGGETVWEPERRQPFADSAFVATTTGTMLHRPDCPVVAGRDNLRRVTPGTPGFEPCKICQPFSAA
jgi:hypothetical protein